MLSILQHIAERPVQYLLGASLLYFGGHIAVALLQ